MKCKSAEHRDGGKEMDPVDYGNVFVLVITHLRARIEELLRGVETADSERELESSGPGDTISVCDIECQTLLIQIDFCRKLQPLQSFFKHRKQIIP